MSEDSAEGASIKLTKIEQQQAFKPHRTAPETALPIAEKIARVLLNIKK